MKSSASQSRPSACSPHKRERRVAHPAVAVVPVALAAGRLGQRRGRGRHRRAGRGVGESLQRQRRALQMLAPAMVREAPAGQPVAPVVEGRLEPVLGVGAVLGAVQAVPPPERDEPLLALGQRVAGARPVALDPDPQIGDQPQNRLAVASPQPPTSPRRPSSIAPACARSRTSARTPPRPGPVPWMHSITPHQHVVGVVIGRRPRVRALVGVLVVPRADRQPVADHDPARRGHPRRLEDHRPGHVAHRQRHDDPVRARRGTSRRGGPAASRTRSASRTAAGTSTRCSRPARPAPRCGSRTGTRSRRSAGTASRRSVGHRGAGAGWSGSFGRAA